MEIIRAWIGCDDIVFYIGINFSYRVSYGLE